MLSAQTQTLDQGAVTVDVNALEVIKHTTTVADHQQQTTTGVVIVLVLLEVLGQISDALGEQSNLDLRRTGVAFVKGILCNDFVIAARCCRPNTGALSIRGRNTPREYLTRRPDQNRRPIFPPPRRRLFFTSRHGREQTAEQHHGKRDEFDCEEQ